MSHRVGVFHPGTQHSWQTALAFQEKGALAWYATSVYYDPKRLPYRLEPLLPTGWRSRVRRELSRRHHPSLNVENIRCLGLIGWIEPATRRAGWSRLTSKLHRLGNTDFGERTIKLASRERVDVVWGYDTSSLEVFRWAKKQGIVCVLDQTNIHPSVQNDLLQGEYEKHPEYFATRYEPFDSDWIARQDEELSLADVIVVGSRFCERTISRAGHDVGKVRIVPYGYDETLFPSLRPVEPAKADQPLRCLFVGQIAARKGIAHLLSAFDELDPRQVSLTLVGALHIPRTTFAKHAHRVHHVPSVSRREVVEHFLSADCFVFPTLGEGGGIVLYEAGGGGLAIIQSDRCGDGVRSPRAGIILDRVDKSEIIKAVGRLLNDRAVVEEMKDEAWRARTERTWKVYRRSICQLLASSQSSV